MHSGILQVRTMATDEELAVENYEEVKVKVIYKNPNSETRWCDCESTNSSLHTFMSVRIARISRHILCAEKPPRGKPRGKH